MSLMAQKIRQFSLIALLVLLAVRIAFAEEQPAIQRRFPNYFVPLEYQLADPSQIPDAVVAQSRALLERVLNEQLKEIEVPLVLDLKRGPEMVRYFELLRAEARKIDPQAEIYPSAGVIRALLAFNYEQMYEKFDGKPSAESQAFLSQLPAQSRSLPGYKVRGVGADFDVWARISKEPRVNTFDAIRARLSEISGSTERFYGRQEGFLDEALKRSLFPKLDIRPIDEIDQRRDYRSQVNRSVQQGGASIDWLSFQINWGNQHGGFVEPQDRAYIVSDFIRGVYRYLSPQTGAVVESPEKQTVRGIRPLLEIGHLRLLDDSQLRAEINTLMERDYQKVPIPEDALYTFARIRRNARESGWFNRIWSAPAGTTEHAIAQFVKHLHEKGYATSDRGGQPLIPVYVEFATIPPGGRPLNGLPERLVMPPAEFRRSYAKNGRLYHGTPSVADSLSILRNGMFATQATGDFRSGGYLSPNRAYSLGYSHGTGPVIERRVEQVNYHVIDLRKHADDPWIQELLKRAHSRGASPEELLFREHGIDAIILTDNEILVKNTRMFEPAVFSDVTSGYATLMESHNADPEDRIKAARIYPMLYAYSTALGDKVVRPKTNTQMLNTMAEIARSHENPEFRATAVIILMAETPDSPRTNALLQKALLELPEKALLGSESWYKGRPKSIVFEKPIEALTSPSKEAQAAAITSLEKRGFMYLGQPPEMASALVSIAVDENNLLKQRATDLLWPPTLRMQLQPIQRRLLEGLSWTGLRRYMEWFALSSSEKLTPLESSILPQKLASSDRPDRWYATAVNMINADPILERLDLYLNAEYELDRLDISNSTIRRALKRRFEAVVELTGRQAALVKAVRSHAITESDVESKARISSKEMGGQLLDLLGHPNSFIRQAAIRELPMSRNTQFTIKAMELLAKIHPSSNQREQELLSDFFRYSINPYITKDRALADATESFLLGQHPHLSLANQLQLVNILELAGRGSARLSELKASAETQILQAPLPNIFTHLGLDRSFHDAMITLKHTSPLLLARVLESLRQGYIPSAWEWLARGILAKAPQGREQDFVNDFLATNESVRMAVYLRLTQKCDPNEFQQAKSWEHFRADPAFQKAIIRRIILGPSYWLSLLEKMDLHETVQPDLPLLLAHPKAAIKTRALRLMGLGPDQHPDESTAMRMSRFLFRRSEGIISDHMLSAAKYHLAKALLARGLGSPDLARKLDLAGFRFPSLARKVYGKAPEAAAFRTQYSRSLREGNSTCGELMRLIGQTNP
ncbi:MAG: hypothetical protein HY537_12490 [Deltaproteobacteria bacterium]|nr:hypothetical protein [Deltaproteobacteria bacterium]